jgi:transcriptional accessory protein Tex/SPT6
VNETTVDVNDAISSPARSHVLRFVSGLGPRSATALLHALDALGREVHSLLFSLCLFVCLSVCLSVCLCVLYWRIGIYISNCILLIPEQLSSRKELRRLKLFKPIVYYNAIAFIRFLTMDPRFSTDSDEEEDYDEANDDDEMAVEDFSEKAEAGRSKIFNAESATILDATRVHPEDYVFACSVRFSQYCHDRIL